MRKSVAVKSTIWLWPVWSGSVTSNTSSPALMALAVITRTCVWPSLAAGEHCATRSTGQIVNGPPPEPLLAIPPLLPPVPPFSPLPAVPPPPAPLPLLPPEPLVPLLPLLPPPLVPAVAIAPPLPPVPALPPPRVPVPPPDVPPSARGVVPGSSLQPTRPLASVHRPKARKLLREQEPSIIVELLQHR